MLHKILIHVTLEIFLFFVVVTLKILIFELHLENLNLRFNSTKKGKA